MSSALTDNTYTVQRGCTSTLIIPDITKAEYSICFIIHCFGENNDKHHHREHSETLLLEIKHSGCNLLYSQLVC